MPSVFFSYSHKDEALRDQLETQLAALKRHGLIDTWHDRRIGAGQILNTAIDNHINQAAVILLLISPDFIASDYCYNIEMTRAMERHEAGEATVIPVILRACDWHSAPFGKLLATPRDGKPVTQWTDRDQAFLEVTKAIKGAVSSRTKISGSVNAPAPNLRPITAISSPSAPRSSNLRVAKIFTERDKDKFQQGGFELIANYFENSLKELRERNSGIETDFRRIDANRFFATVYRNGKDVARATIYMGGLMKGINYVHGQATESNSFNESLNVQTDDQSLYFTSLGMAHMGSARGVKLSPEGAAELFWGMLIEPLQRG